MRHSPHDWPAIPSPDPGKEALSQATKDLMSLDVGFYDYNKTPVYGPYSGPSSVHPNHLQSPASSSSSSSPSYPTFPMSSTFPFLQARRPLPLPPLQLPQTQGAPPQPAPSLLPHANPTSPHITPALSSSQTLDAQRHISRETTPRAKHAAVRSSSRRKSSSSLAAAGGDTGGRASNILLSVSQKKANHIQSEQKRRANIRRGYEALCDAVPTLREAIQAEDSGDSRPAKIIDGEKIDGRAGPRSENVVLVKTIEYINLLVEERAALLQRLERARGALGTPLASSEDDTPPLWERRWDGGSGKDPYCGQSYPDSDP